MLEPTGTAFTPPPTPLLLSIWNGAKAILGEICSRLISLLFSWPDCSSVKSRVATVGKKGLGFFGSSHCYQFFLLLSAVLCLWSGLLVLQLSSLINSKSKYRQMLTGPRMLWKLLTLSLKRNIFWDWFETRDSMSIQIPAERGQGKSWDKGVCSSRCDGRGFLYDFLRSSRPQVPLEASDSNFSGWRILYREYWFRNWCESHRST